MLVYIILFFFISYIMLFVLQFLSLAFAYTNNSYATFGHTKFSNMTKEEFSKSHGYNNQITDSCKILNYTMPETIPMALDWRTHNVVTPVKDQAQCGSCWAFSATENIEGQYARKSGTLVSLSEQELVSCDKVDGGCSGGLMKDAMTWVKKNGLTSEKTYPYKSGDGEDGNCSKKKEKKIVTKISECYALDRNETLLLGLINDYGPLSIAIDGSTFQNYINGTIVDCEFDFLDHGVLLVGYDLTALPPYWIIKNSWGTDWGLNGYAKVVFGTNACGLSQQASTVVI